MKPQDLPDQGDEIRSESPSGQPQKVSLDHRDSQDGVEANVVHSIEPLDRVAGIQAVREALSYERFPMTLSDVDYAIGDVELSDGVGGSVAIRDLTDSIASRELSSADEVIDALVAARDAISGKTAA